MSRTIEVVVEGGGQLVVPREFSDASGLAPGMTLEVEEGDGGGLLLRVTGTPEIVDKGGILVIRGPAQAGLAGIAQRTRAERLLEFERHSREPE